MVRLVRLGNATVAVACRGIGVGPVTGALVLHGGLFLYAAFGSLRSRGGCSLPLRLLRHAFQVCVAYFIGGASRLELYGLAKKESLAPTASWMLFSGCLVPFRRAEAAPLLPSTAQPNYWPLPVSEGIGGGLESGGIGTPEGRGMQQERIENDGDLLYFPVILRCWRHRFYLHRGVHSAPAGLDASGVCTALA